MISKTSILRALTVLMFFILTSVIVALIMKNSIYFLLFSGIGILAGLTEYAIGANPEKSQIIRKTVHIFLAGTLVILAIFIGINFQFSQVCFDLYSGIITGALIQFCTARLLLPLFFGNAFCSRACWNGAIFEFADITGNSENKGSKLSAWIFMAFIVIVTFIIYIYDVPKTATNNIRNIFIIENSAIIMVGLVLSIFSGKRFYCRKLCPFLPFSGFVSKFSLFKITPHKNMKCINCGKCNENCPMGIDVMDYVKLGNRINHPDCILCEKCVNVCKSGCLSLDIKS